MESSLVNSYLLQFLVRLTVCCGIKADIGVGEGIDVKGGGLIPSIFNSLVASECRKCGKLF